jgi:hypothetical protein
MNETRNNPEVERSSKVGRLEELNGHRQLTGRLWADYGTTWTCHFKTEHTAYLSEPWMHTVKLPGPPLLKAGKEYGLEVDSIRMPIENREIATKTTTAVGKAYQVL